MNDNNTSENLENNSTDPETHEEEISPYTANTDPATVFPVNLSVAEAVNILEDGLRAEAINLREMLNEVDFKNADDETLDELRFIANSLWGLLVDAALDVDTVDEDLINQEKSKEL